MFAQTPLGVVVGVAECALETNLNVRNPAPLFSSREICTARIPSRVCVFVCLFVGMSAGKASRNLFVEVTFNDPPSPSHPQVIFPLF